MASRSSRPSGPPAAVCLEALRSLPVNHRRLIRKWFTAAGEEAPGRSAAAAVARVSTGVASGRHTMVRDDVGMVKVSFGEGGTRGCAGSPQHEGAERRGTRQMSQVEKLR